MNALRCIRPQRHGGMAVRMLLRVLALLGVLVAAPARASGANCSLVTTPLAFGKYDPSVGAPADFTATITVTCTASGITPVAIHGSITLAGAGGFASRQLASGAQHLRYQLYVDPGRTVPWGDGSGDALSVSGVAGPTAPFRQAVTVYGRILARQTTAHVGAYTDLIIFVMNY
jgi:spore coat protein U-like protein